MQSREAIEAYPQRTADLVVVEAGKSQDVPTTIIMPPTIYAPGTGPFNRSSIQIPTQICGALKVGRTGYIGDGDGDGQWDYVHIQDLASLYELVVLDFVTGRNRVGRGERGIVFTGSGSFTWREMAANVNAAGQELGVLLSRNKHDGAESWTLARAAETWFGGGDGSSDSSSSLALEMAGLGMASNSRTKSDVARSIGWVPTRTGWDWSENFRTEFQITLDQEIEKKKNKRGDNL